VQTHELIDMLADDASAVSPIETQRRLALAALAGAAIALVMVVAWLRLRPDLSQAIGGGFFWMRAAYTAALGVTGFWASERLARPETSARGAATAGAALVAAIAVVAALQFAPLPAAARIPTLEGVSWQVCSRNIVILATPMTLICLFVLRGLAPTRPWLTGFAAGAFAGGVAATVYGLHCPETTFVFVGLWYTLGIVASGLIGAIIGRFALRW
jgi:hypothetical protein